MGSPQYFKRLLASSLSGGGGNGGPCSSLLCQDSKRFHSMGRAIKKLKDTVLVIEATKGPVARVSCGVAQAAGAATLVFGTGCGVTALINYIDPKVDTFEKFTSGDEHHDEMAAKLRVAISYFHTGSALLASTLTAALSFKIFKNKEFLQKMSNRPLAVLGFGVITPFIMSNIVHHLPFTPAEEGVIIPFGMKEIGHLFYAGSIGLFAAPLYLLGGQAIMRGAYLTAGTCAGLHAVEHVAPKNTFLNWGKPLAYASHVILLSFVLTLLLRGGHFAFMPLYRLMMHGGLIVYSAHYVYTLQSMREAAKSALYDPVNASMALTMDMLNLFGRLTFLVPPHFSVSNDHLFVMLRGRPAVISVINKPTGNNTNNNGLKPGKES